MNDLAMATDFRFDTFVVGQDNTGTVGTLMALANKTKSDLTTVNLVADQHAYGVTHLLTAVAARRNELFPGTAHYLTLQQLAQLPISAITKPDMLCIDDVEVSSSATEITALLNTLIDRRNVRGKSTLVALPRAFGELYQRHPKLATRLSWGPMLRLHRPTLLTIELVVDRYIVGLVPPLTADQCKVVHRICCIEHLDVRGAVRNALAFRTAYEETHGDFAAAVATVTTEELGGSLPGVPIDVIIDAVCELHEVRRAELVGPRRDKRLALARHYAIYLARELNPSLTLVEVGSFFSGRDHSTILHAVNKIRKMIFDNPEVHACIDNLRNQVRGLR